MSRASSILRTGLGVCSVTMALACASARPAPGIATTTSAIAGGAREAEPSVARSPQAPSAPILSARPDLFVHCEDGTRCPDGVGMLVVDSRPPLEPERCTVTLIERDRALTASHCLAPGDRREGARCERTWVVFPETASAPAEWIACQRVVTATAAIDEHGLHQEHAVLQLAHASARAPLAVDPLPPEPGSIVTVVSVTPHPVYASTHALSTRLCRAIDATAAESELGDSATQVGWLADCPIARGNSGSPVLDYYGHVRAIVHGGTSQSSAFGVTSKASD